MESIKNKKIFVVGMFRSGTTLLARALGAHKNISFASDPFFEFFKYIRSKYYSKYLKRKFDWQQPFGDKFIEDNDFNNEFLANFSSLNLNEKDLEKIKDNLGRGTGIEYSPKIFPLFPKINKLGKAIDVLKSFVNLIPQAYPKQNLKAVGFKEVWLEEFISPLIRENFNCLHIIRDPRAVVASNKASSTGRYPILFLIRQWRKSVAYAIINENNKRYLQVKFEDIIKNPAKNFKNICHFLQINYTKDLVDPIKYKDGAGKPWKQNSSFRQTRKFNSEAIDRWKKVLTKDEIKIIEILCEPEMKYFGYKPMHKNSSFKDVYAFHDNKRGIASWIKKYDYDITNKRRQEEITRLFILQNPQIKWGEDCLKTLFISKKVYITLSSVWV